MGSPGSGIEVFVFQGSKYLGSRCFSQSTITIGSASDATLKLRGKGIEAQHALIRVEGTSVLIADNSQGGIDVNGKRVQMQAVKSYDEINIGPFRLKVSLLGHEEDEDPGFGAVNEQAPEPKPPSRHRREAPALRPSNRLLEDDEAETLVRQFGEIGDSGEATVPRIDPRAEARRSPDPYADAEYGDDLLGDSRRRVEVRSLDPQTAYDQTELATTVDPSTTASTTASARDESPPASNVGATIQPRLGQSERLEMSASDEAGVESTPPPSINAVEDDDYWGDDDDEDFVEPFSLLENVVRERFKSAADTEDRLLAEVIRYGDGEILDVLQAAPGRAVKLFPDDFKLIDTLANGRARLYFKRGFGGNIVRNNKARQLTRLIRQETLVDAKRGLHAIDLQEGDYAQIVREDAGYLVRFVHPPRIPKPKLTSGLGLGWSTVQIFAGSAAFHFLLLVLLGFSSADADLVVETESERFAKVALKELKLEKPKKEEPKKPPEKPPEKPTKQKIKPTKQKVMRRPTKSRRPMTAKQQAKVRKKQVGKVLSALQNLKQIGGGGRSNLKSFKTNIKAIRLPGGSSGGFKVSGVIGKIPGKAVRLASGGIGGGGKGTKVGRQLLAGGKIGKIAALKGTGRRVRGRVRRAPTRTIKATGGVLSRAAIQKVVSRHMHKVQACYERQLLTNPGLSGKVVFDWVISPSGSVGSARQTSSSLRSAAVSTCILREIRRWRFPKPVGGSVNVRYPFVFRVQGF
ncbi:MAG: hypothetical protein CSB49_04800 [Proteobacteria bacterium]|nr:MAG: hypothetical protein CSB49_04800 [Pseudomonadota bacterium]